MTDIADIEPAQRLYTIQNDIYHYLTGHLSNGNQVLMLGEDKTNTGEIPRVEFDPQGNVVAAYTQDHLPAPTELLHFEPGTIFVKSFFIEEMWFGVDDLPDHYQEFLDDPANATAEEHLHYPEEIRVWQENGDFVLWCNEDYYLNKSGELVSS
jgi:hypothetical protein